MDITKFNIIDLLQQKNLNGILALSIETTKGETKTAYMFCDFSDNWGGGYGAINQAEQLAVGLSQIARHDMTAKQFSIEAFKINTKGVKPCIDSIYKCSDHVFNNLD